MCSRFFVPSVLGGAFSVSVHSQAGRLEDILERNDRFVDGKYVASDNEVSDEDLYEMSQVLNYLVEEREVYWVIEPWFEEELDFSDVNRWSQAEFVMEDGFGLEYRFYVPSRGEPDPRESFNFSLSDLNVAIPIDNHEFVFEYYNHLITPISVGEKTLRLAVNQAEERIDLTLDDDPLGYIPLKELIDRGMKSSQFRPMHLEDATVVVQTEKFNAKVVVKSLQGYKEDDRVFNRLHFHNDLPDSRNQKPTLDKLGVGFWLASHSSSIQFAIRPAVARSYGGQPSLQQ